MIYRITSWLPATLMLFSIQATAASLSDIRVANGDQQARITISFIGDPGIFVHSTGQAYRGAGY